MKIIRITLNQGDTFTFNGVEYAVRSLDYPSFSAKATNPETHYSQINLYGYGQRVDNDYIQSNYTHNVYEFRLNHGIVMRSNTPRTVARLYMAQNEAWIVTGKINAEELYSVTGIQLERFQEEVTA
jgi:hypothetical protein